MRAPTLGLAVIACDEARALPGLLESICGCFDQVALLDTGSTDETPSIFERWAAGERARHSGFVAKLGHRRWRSDFAAARNAADRMLETDWLAWADADDAIWGAHHLRRLVAAAPSSVAALMAGYRTSMHAFSNAALGSSQRIRVVRRGAGRWRYPVHEDLVVNGEIAGIAGTTTLWVHRKSRLEAGASQARNLQILRRWLDREPDHPRALQYAGREAAALGDHAGAVAYFERFFKAWPAWDELSAQIHRRYAISLIELGRFADAEDDAAAVAAALPVWPDSYLTLAETALQRGDSAGAIANARRVLELGAPPTTLPQAVTDYSSYPGLIVARALRRRGAPDAARGAAIEALGAIADSG